MDFLNIDTTSKQTVKDSFSRIAEELFNHYLLQVNESYYRLIDIEFYYLTGDNNIHKDVYTHKHAEQRHSGRWYFHDSGIDITIGNGSNHYGGILMRAIAKINNEKSDNNYIDYQMHGPVKVKSEICERFNDAFGDSPNYFRLVANHNNESHKEFMVKPLYIIKTQRINLNSQKDIGEMKYWDSKYRYVILLNKCQFKYANKTQIAMDLQEQHTLTNEQVNKLLGSKFL
jgi:hypothetical protein